MAQTVTMVSLNSRTLYLQDSLPVRLHSFSPPPVSNFRIRTGFQVHKRIQIDRSFHAGSSSNGFKIFGRPYSRFSLSNPPAFHVSSSGNGGGSGGSGDDTGGGGGYGSGDSGKGDGESNWYLFLLAKYPVLTKAVTSSLLNMVGDVICQLVIDRAPSLDLKRTFIFTLLGLVLVGPTLHFWYLFLSRLVTSTGASGAFIRLLLDQFLFSPIFIGVFLSALVTLEGKPSHVWPKLQQEWFSSVIANWKLWIPFQFLNFRFVPQQFQVLASNFVALIWNVILSFKAHKEVIAK